MNFFDKLDAVMKQDFGGRGLLGSLPPSPLSLAAKELFCARRALILTGFPVLCPDGSVIGETDGPLGSADLAFALKANGCQVTVATDAHSSELVKAALSVRCPDLPVTVLPETGTRAFSEQLLDTLCPTHVITLERPGKAADGHYHNMRGEIIDFMTADADCFLELAARRNIRTLSIGDGGNEMGMGAFRKEIESFVPCGEIICTAASADCVLAGGVSNWWGIGAAALLSMETGAFLLPSEAQETEMLRRVIEAGGVDGTTKLREMTVDHLPLSVHLEILRDVSSLVRKAQEEQAA